MNTSTATTTIAASAMLAAPFAEEQPAYRYAGDGKFEPANAAAWSEINAWNAYATMMTDRSAAARSRHHDH